MSDKIWTRILANPNSTYNTGRSSYQDIYDLVAALVSGRVLDVGCGLGHLTGTLKVPVLGIDISKVAIEEAKRRHPHGNFAVENVETTNRLEKGKYDCVCFTQVLEHITEDQALVKRIPSGKKVFISVPKEQPRPHESHVNFFGNIDMLRDRYSDLIDIKYIGEVGPLRFLCLYGTRI
jgi:2-polyprenyl-3-methyl-5-hydroxy-6-metoxy-1,4-benzoquinol methylase